MALRDRFSGADYGFPPRRYDRLRPRDPENLGGFLYMEAERFLFVWSDELDLEWA